MARGMETQITDNRGGGGLFLACKDFRRMFDHSFPACASFFFFFFVEEIRSHTLIPLVCQD